MNSFFLKKISKDTGITIHDIYSEIRTNKPRTYKTKIIKKGQKVRTVIDINSLKAAQKAALDYLSEILIQNYNIRFPNRDDVLTDLINTMTNLTKYKNLVISRYDIENFYESIDIQKLMNILEKSNTLDYYELNYIKSFMKIKNKLFPGLKIVNVLSEIIGIKIDHIFIQSCSELNNKTIYYLRYVDDIIVINDNYTKYYTKDLNIKLKECAGNNIKFNKNKEKHIYATTSKADNSFDFLGYTFTLCFKKNMLRIIKLGISSKKTSKLTDKIKYFINEYKQDKNINKLLLELELLYKRYMYLSKDSEGNIIGHNRGFFSSYRLLNESPHSLFIKKGLFEIEDNTKKLLNGSIINDIWNKMMIDPVPKKIDQYIKSNKYYNLIMFNRAFIANPKIGLSKSKMIDIGETLLIKNSKKIPYKELSIEIFHKIYE